MVTPGRRFGLAVAHDSCGSPSIELDPKQQDSPPNRTSGRRNATRPRTPRHRCLAGEHSTHARRARRASPFPIDLRSGDTTCRPTTHRVAAKTHLVLFCRRSGSRARPRWGLESSFARQASGTTGGTTGGWLGCSSPVVGSMSVMGCRRRRMAAMRWSWSMMGSSR